MAYSLDDTFDAVLLVQQFEEDEKIARQLQSQYEEEYNALANRNQINQMVPVNLSVSAQNPQRSTSIIPAAHPPQPVNIPAAFPMQSTSIPTPRNEALTSRQLLESRLPAPYAINFSISNETRELLDAHENRPSYFPSNAVTTATPANWQYLNIHPSSLTVTNDVQVEARNPFRLQQTNGGAFYQTLDQTLENTGTAYQRIMNQRARTQNAVTNQNALPVQRSAPAPPTVVQQQNQSNGAIAQNTRPDQNNVASANFTSQQFQSVANSPINEGLSRSNINRLPSRIFNKKKNQTSPDQMECLICLCDWKEREKLRILPCLHEFHSRCVDSWLKKSGTCPKCRFVVSIPTYDDSDDQNNTLN